MRLARRTPCLLVLAAALTVLVTTGTALAQQAEIAGIDKVYLRPTPGTDQTPLGVLNAGDRVNILDIEGSWTKVETADGKIGFVYHRYVVPLSEGGIPPIAAPTVAPPTPRALGLAPATPRVAAVPQTLATTAPAVAPPTPQPTPDPLSVELSGLRAELSELREKMQKRAAEAPEPESTSAAPEAPRPQAATAEQGVSVLAVAFVFLVIGWVLGAAFHGRRTKSQRRRLRL
jgi:hypothetical protein